MSVQRHQTGPLTLSNHGEQLVFRSAGEVEFLGPCRLDFDGEATVASKRHEVAASFHARASRTDHRNGRSFTRPMRCCSSGEQPWDGTDAFVGASKHLPEFTLVSARHGPTSVSIVLDNFGEQEHRKTSSMQGTERRPIG